MLVCKTQTIYTPTQFTAQLMKQIKYQKSEKRNKKTSLFLISSSSTSLVILSKSHCLWFYLWFEQTAADSVPQTGPGSWGFPLNCVSLFFYTVAGLIQTLLLISITFTHYFWHEYFSTLTKLWSFYWPVANKETSAVPQISLFSNRSGRSFFPEHSAIDQIVLKHPSDRHFCRPAESLKYLQCHLHVSA